MLTKGDEWRKKRARTVRSKRARRAGAAERLLVRASVFPGLILLAAGAAFAVALMRVVLGKTASSWAGWGGEAAVASIALALGLEVLAQMAAQMKGDEAQGPIHFYKAAAFAEWFETHPGPRRNIQITSGVY